MSNPTFPTYNGTAETAVKLYTVLANSRVLTMARYTGGDVTTSR